MKFYASGEDLAKDMGIPVTVLEETHDAHFKAAKKTEKDPDGGSWPAYPSGKSWDEASGKTGSGKKFYHNIIAGSAVAKEPFYVAIITPVIHYCMGGLEVDVNSSCMASNGNAIPGLYAAGEVAGGVHGNNRLGGNSLLDCVVFGRVAGAHAAKYILGDDAKPVSLKELASLPPLKKAAAGADDKKPAAGASAPSTSGNDAPKAAKVKGSRSDRKDDHYDPKKWDGHLRGMTMGWWLKRKAAKRAAERAAEEKAQAEAEAMEKGKAAIEAIKPVWWDREQTTVDMHYFPLPDEHGARSVIPFFTDSRKSPPRQVGGWCFDCCCTFSQNQIRKGCFCFAIFASIVVSVLTVHANSGPPPIAH
jgi:hypothetical protein